MSSLFGNNNQNTQTTQAPLFGGTATSQPQQSSNVFGGFGKPQPQQSGGLFGSSTSTSQPQQGGGLFGTASTSQPQQASGLFGSTPASQPQQTGGLFGSAPTSQPQATGSLFGSTSSTSQPTQSNSLFGNSLGNQQQQSQAPQSTSLFAPKFLGGQNQNQNQTTQQPAQTTSLFAPKFLGGQTQNQNDQQSSSSPFTNANAQKPAFSLFGSGNNAQTQQPQQQQQKPSLFGTSNTTQAPQSTSLFGTSNNNPAQQQNTSLFGTSNTNVPQQQNTSLFGTSTLRPGGLTMGQTGGAPQQQQQQPQTVPGVRIDVSNLRGTTRFNDLHEELQRQIEQIDAFIQQQIAFKEQCDALMPAHEDTITSIPADVTFVRSKLDTTELALANDGAAVELMKGVVRRDAEDARLSFRVLENLKLPQQFHYTGMWQQQHQQQQQQQQPHGADAPAPPDPAAEPPTDLVSYVSTTASGFGATLDRYTAQLGELETHLRTLEIGVVQQSQQALFRRGADGAGRGREEQVRELGAVLREFEAAILGVAQRVGGTREGIAGLVEAGRGRSVVGGGTRWGR